MGVILMFHSCEEQSHTTPFEVKGKPKQIRTDVPLFTSLPPYRLTARPNRLTRIVVVDRIYIALISALSSRLTALTCDSTRVNSFFIAFLNSHRSGVLTELAWLVPHETAAISERSVYTIQPCTMSLHAKPHT